RFAELKAVLYIKKKVSLNESSLINQPMVIGFFKPVVLVPIGLLSGLPPKEVEAILLHELAHIRRNDYLINLLQSFLETIFFFNPFFYWLSSMIRNEREHCCDALAIKHTGSKKTFVQALLSFHEQATPSPYVMALMGRNSLLVERVNRIVSGKTNRISPLEKFIVAACYALLFVSLVSFSFMNKKDKPPSEMVKSVVEPPRLNSHPSQPTINKDTTVSLAVTARRTDTIPRNASKEFLDGYKAGYNYKHQQPGLADKKRKQLEAELSKRTDPTITRTTQAGPGITTTVTQSEANRKRKIEEALIAERKDN
ncbi:MAG TPA: M56 family metallopeptidase, partial [Flavobacterium sp.]|nr:M56 family metallopeptidase [Flavobacterium sp.]